MNPSNIKFRNLNLRVYSNQKDAQQTIVFVHGNSGSSKIWEKQFESKLSQEFQLLAVDLPGCGGSTHSEMPDQDYNLFDLGDAVNCVVENFALQKYIIVAHSLGGNIVMQSIDKFKNCKGFMFIGTPPIGIPPAMDKMFLPNPNLGVLFMKDVNESEVTLLINDFILGTKYHDFLKEDFLKADGMLRQTILSNASDGKFIDEINALKKSKTPIAFVCGEKEKIVNNDYFEILSFDTYWKEKLVKIPGAAHCPHIENAEEFNDVLKEFIRSVSL